MREYDRLMEARIQFGDEVTVLIVEGGAEYKQEAVVLNVPQDPDDFWEFLRPDGSVFVPNIYHARFVGVVKEAADG